MRAEDNIKTNEQIIKEQQAAKANPNRRPRRKIKSVANKKGEFVKQEYEHNNKNILFPKIVGASTSLAFMNCSMIMFPNWQILGYRF